MFVAGLAELKAELIRLSENNTLFIVGAGHYGNLLGYYMVQNKIVFECYFDKDDSKKNLNGKPVLRFDGIKPLSKNCYYIISSVNKRSALHSELSERGCADTNIIEYDNNQIINDILDGFLGKSDERIRGFHNLYKGQRCFIIGNGPSLTSSDLEKLKNEKTFGCNSIFKIFKSTTWRPNFYYFFDSGMVNYFSLHKDDLNLLLRECDNVFTGYITSFELNSSKIFPLRIISRKASSFSEDCAKECYGGGSVAYVMLQCACYFGFKEIYLLGMDFSFSCEKHNDGSVIKNEGVCNHNPLLEIPSINESVRKEFGVPYFFEIDEALKAYETASEYAVSHGIKIYNATRGGKLEVFPRVNFDSLFYR